MRHFVIHKSKRQKLLKTNPPDLMDPKLWAQLLIMWRYSSMVLLDVKRVPCDFSSHLFSSSAEKRVLFSAGFSDSVAAPVKWCFVQIWATGGEEICREIFLFKALIRSYWRTLNGVLLLQLLFPQAVVWCLQNKKTTNGSNDYMTNVFTELTKSLLDTSTKNWTLDLK